MALRVNSVRTQLTTAFGFLLLIIVAMSAVAIVALHDATQTFSSYVNGIDARKSVAEGIRGAILRRDLAMRDLVLAATPGQMDEAVARIRQTNNEANRLVRQLQDMASHASDASATTIQRIEAVEKVEADYSPLALRIAEQGEAHHRDEALKLIDEQGRPALVSVLQALDAYMSYTQDRSQHLLEQYSQDHRTDRNIILILAACSLIGALVLSIRITANILKSLGAEPTTLKAIAARVAQGDLRPIREVAAAKPGSVLASMGEMQSNLIERLRAVAAAAKHIEMSSTQIAASNTDLSTRTEAQASSLEETAAALSQLSASVTQTAENARHASTLVDGVDEAILQSSRMLEAVRAQMDQINVSSGKMGDIVGTIDSIAFQTNILALNAAVEAARAGGHGKGFAVVASEVRALAQRSSASAKEIRKLIDTSVEQIRQGGNVAKDAEAAMSHMTANAGKVGLTIKEIAHASIEQSEGIAQINLAVGQIDSATQSNAALVEMTASASSALQLEAQNQSAAVGYFRFDEGERLQQLDEAAPVVALQARRVAQLSYAIPQPGLRNLRTN
ncbi:MULTISPECIES: methyl-accepting chemotaxis protein [unclassified Achromobacter]|uniref:methyl-accepting chemotaxis protein n=1 Tax=unclassified Achromobacter TaxID=2626865 RepID=UPI000B518E62|nr:MULTISPECIES: methyl-accepting chemotaxis protein [unclassified Achromobacter]OWT80776.1 methyl-accepting chemotaxis protein [Achromobacter sp. HZ34]OWT81292.1 methyl-accepting chemotaxis protein [Achromobacter sp. HZ28]